MTHANPHRGDARGVDWSELRELRDAGAALPLTDGGFILTRHEDVVSALRTTGSPPAFSHEFTLRGEASRVPAEEQLMSEMDGPRHLRRRKLLLSALHPRLIRNATGFVEKLAHRLVDDLLQTGGGDLVARYARPIPAQTLAYVIGLPVQDHEQFQVWSDAVVRGAATNRTDLGADHPEFAAYIDALAIERRRNPRADLVSEIAGGVEGDRFTATEIRTLVMHLIVAGNETTSHLIAHLLRRLLEDPSLLDSLACNPASIPAAVEEALRIDPPVVMRPLQATRTLDIGDARVPAASRIVASIASANRDERAFAQPDRFLLERPATNDHLSFGGGAHFCPGAALARMEAQVATRVFVERVLEGHIDSGWTPRAVPIVWAFGLVDLPASLASRVSSSNGL